MIEADRLAIQKVAANVAMQRADADEAEATANGVKLDKLLKYLDGLKAEIGSRLDAVGARLDAVETKNKDERSSDGTRPVEAEEVAADEAAAVAEIQSRFDSMAQEHGLRAPRAMIGELAADYRKRMLRKFSRHSPDFKDADFSKIVDSKTLDGIEQRIAADSHEAAMNPVVEPGRLLQIDKTDRSGRVVSEFHGPQTFVKLMSRSPRFIQSIRRDW